MVELSRIQELADSLSNVLPPGLAGMRDELRANFRAVLQSRLEQLDLVSREQFEVQKAVLERANERLAALEEEVARLERERGD